jgi:hypothetical protein
MTRQISKRLDRLEAKVPQSQSTLLNAMEDIEDAYRRWVELNGRDIREGGLPERERAKRDRLQKHVDRMREGQCRMSELVLREHGGTPLTDEEARELADLNRWCPPDPLLPIRKAVREQAKRVEDQLREAALNSEA